MYYISCVDHNLYVMNIILIFTYDMYQGCRSAKLIIGTNVNQHINNLALYHVMVNAVVFYLR